MDRYAAEGADRFDHLHGDEDRQPLSIAEQHFVNTRADEYIAHRLYRSPEHFNDLLSGVDCSSYESQLQRAMRELDAACKGDKTAIDAVLQSLSQIQRTLKAEAESLWQDECEALAKADL